MGTTVYEADPENHVYCHSRRDGKEGFAYVLINNDLEQPMMVTLPGPAQLYALAGADGIRSSTMTLNGKTLLAGPNGELPDLTGIAVSETITLPPGSCAFLTL